MGDALLPCPKCGADAFNAEDTTITVNRGYRFQEKEATRQVPAKICPECGHRFGL